MSERIQALGYHVLIRPIKAVDDSPSAKYIHGKSQTQPDKGVVVEIGEKVESEALRGAIGKTVIYRKYSPEEYTINGEKLYLIEEADIMGIWHKK